MTNKIGFENDQLLIGATQSSPAAGANIFSNPSFETWDIMSVNWNAGSALQLKSIDAHTDLPDYPGIYAADLSQGTDIGNISAVSQVVMGTPGDSYTMKFWAKSPSGTKHVFIVYAYPDIDGFHIWNFSGGDAGTFALMGVSPTADQLYAIGLTSSYAQYTSPSPQVTIPSVGMLLVFVMSGFDVTDAVVDDLEFRKDGTGPNVFTDPSIEDWQIINPTDWSIIGTTVSQETSLVHSGSYAARFSSISGQPAGLLQFRTGLDTGDYYRMAIWASKTNSASINLYMFVMSDNNGDANTQAWNWITQQWVNQQSAQWADIMVYFTLTEEYDHYVSPAFSVPAGGGLFTAAFVYSQDAVVVDDVVLQKLTYPTSITLFDYLNQTDSTNLLSSDSIFKFRTKGGSEKLHFGLTANGKFTTDYNAFDFTGKHINTLTENLGLWDTDSICAINNAMLRKMALTVLGVNACDMKTSTQYFILRIHNASFVPMFALFQCNTVDNLTSQPTISIGTEADGYTKLMNNTALTFVNADEGCVSLIPVNQKTWLFYNTQISLNVVIPAVADIYNASVTLIGYVT